MGTVRTCTKDVFLVDLISLLCNIPVVIYLVQSIQNIYRTPIHYTWHNSREPTGVSAEKTYTQKAREKETRESLYIDFSVETRPFSNIFLTCSLLLDVFSVCAVCRGIGGDTCTCLAGNQGQICRPLCGSSYSVLSI